MLMRKSRPDCMINGAGPVAPGPLRSTGTNPGARPSPGGDPLQGGPQAQPSPGGPEVPGQPQPPQPAVPGRGRDSSSPFAHAFFNAITSEGGELRSMSGIVCRKKADFIEPCFSAEQSPTICS